MTSSDRTARTPLTAPLSPREAHFKTTEFRIRVTVHADGTWTYDEDTVMEVGERTEPFHHRDRNTLVKIAEPTPNPLMR